MTACEEALIAWGGILGQIVLLFTTLTLAFLSGPGEGVLTDDLLASLTGGNVALALFNLIPIHPLDGARAWRLLPIGLARIGSRLMASGKNSKTRRARRRQKTLRLAERTDRRRECAPVDTSIDKQVERIIRSSVQARSDDEGAWAPRPSTARD